MDPATYYVETTKRLAAGQHFWALFVHLTILAAVLPNLRLAAIVVASAVALTLFNLATSKVLMSRWSPVAVEWFRHIGNVGIALGVYHIIGWPPAAFMWLAYGALATGGGFEKHVTYSFLASQAVAYATLSIVDGVAWQRPVAWIAVAIICRVTLDQRVALAQEMRVASEHANANMQREIEARERAELELREAQKLEAMGRLASGVAHEINNPLQFVDNSVELVAEGVTELLERVDRWRRKVDDPRIPENVRAELDHIERQWDLPVLRADVQESLTSMRAGVRRVTTIVRAMKEFAQPERATKTMMDLNRTIDATLLVARHEYANVAEVTTKLGILPRVMGQPAAISQVLLGLLMVSAGRLSQPKRTGRGKITIKSFAEPGWVVVTVNDTGPAISAADQEKMLEPFGPTYSLARGLGIARSIMESHQGRLEIESERDRDTTFTLRLPLPVATEKAA